MKIELISWYNILYLGRYYKVNFLLFKHFYLNKYCVKYKHLNFNNNLKNKLHFF